MCEAPSNVILAADFAEPLDGFSIGSNDLTQLTLGIDKAVKWMTNHAISAAHLAATRVGLWGKGPSDHR